MKEWNSTYNLDNNSTLRKLQLVELDILKIFVNICEKYDLRYYMIGGTMLGAIRHNRFIPWDDDIDIGMPRPDYEKFLRLVQNALPLGYELLNFKKNKEYKRYFSRIVNKNVIVYNASNTNTIKENAWIDIFPIDGMPNNALKRKIHFSLLTIIRFFYHASCFDELVNLNRPGRKWYLQTAIKFIAITHIGKSFNTIRLLHKIENMLLKYEYDNCDYVANFFGAYMSKEILNKFLIGDVKKYDFEDIRLYGPEKFDEYLKTFYGDYMKPPSDSHKDKHNILKIEFN